MKNEELIAIRDGFGKGIVKAGADKNVYALCADLDESLRLEEFKKIYPEQFVECGVAEQNMIGIAAGLALTGKIPFACSFACFSPGRTFDQIRVSVCYQKSNVKIVGGHAGLSVGEDGATHQMMEDIAMMRALPNMTVIVPADAYQAENMVAAAIKHDGPVYMRLSRAKTALVTDPKEPFMIGKSAVMKTGKDLTIVACGIMVAFALEAAEILKKDGIDAEVINASTIKPFDNDTLLKSAKKTQKVVTIEEHQIHGGLGSTVAEVLSQHLPTPLHIIGMPDEFGQSGEAMALLEYYGFTAKSLAERITQVLNSKF
ncbi:MAG: transketolase [Candidatus Abawacabacteria bacterium RBG_16_42_10]|uniref:Transketolase n=1 Tax=Candidatus Abawacabacteria bacterium RBG_16_42_10 TaxID=1817814 RepID=A0A1F4XLP9_9BACT|nr:MAG: transketolase [Candidatus Abawacabacteria bacterium RBG_16_42_10]